MMQKVTSHQIVPNLVTLRGQNGEKLYACKFKASQKKKKKKEWRYIILIVGVWGGGLPMSVCLPCSTFAVRHNST